MAQRKQAGRLKVCCSALMITGVAIGIGLLALPVKTGLAGFFPSALAMLLLWVCMLSTGWALAGWITAVRLEVDFGSLYQSKLGYTGKLLTLVSYLILLYGAIVAHLAASGSVLEALFPGVMPASGWIVAFFVLSGLLTVFGLGVVERANRILIGFLFLVFGYLVFEVSSHVEVSRLRHTDWAFVMSTLPVMAAALTYHVVIPGVCEMLDYNLKDIRSAIALGSFLPVLIYILWMAVVIGALPLDGSINSLAGAFDLDRPATIPLAASYPGSPIRITAYLFSLAALIPSYILLSSSLNRFLRDLLPKASPRRNFWALMLALPVCLFIVLIYPKLFLSALDLVGGFSIVLLFCLMPAVIAYRETPWVHHARKLGWLAVALVFGVLLGLEIAHELGFLKLAPDMEYFPLKVNT
jgi:tyrosine-specific transport protein